MTSATAKAMDPDVAEELGRATLQIVHDLKNQLNGLKLYATFLRKRLEREDRSSEERETVAKLISGLDAAAHEMTVLVRYARPLELRKRPGADLRKVVLGMAQTPNRDSGGLERPPVAFHIDDAAMQGDFDEALVLEALNAVTDELRHSISAKREKTLSLHVHREADEAMCEWRGGKVNLRYQPFESDDGCGTLYTALAAKIFAAHGGRVKCEGDIVRAWLPLTKQD